jgi:hypothetical protein
VVDLCSERISSKQSRLDLWNYFKVIKIIRLILEGREKREHQNGN